MMKKFLSLALALVMVLSLVACGGNNNPPAADDNKNPDTPPVEDNNTDAPETPDDTPVSYTDASHDSQEIYEMVLGEFTEAYAKALDCDNESERFALMAIAEAKLLQSGVFVPTTSKGGRYAIGRVVPYCVTPTLWGTDDARFYRNIVLADGLLKDADRVAMKTHWNEIKDTATDEAEYLDWVRQYLADHGYETKDSYGIPYSDDPKTFDAFATYRASDHEVLVNTFDGLLEYNIYGQQAPALAESYDVSDDGLTYTFHIRDAVWTDSQGRELGPVTADDWVAGLQHLMDNPGNLEYLFSGIIAGVSEYLDGTSLDMSNVGVKAVDEKTLEVTLEHPSTYFITMLGYGGLLAPLNRAYYESQGGTFGAGATSGSYGTGPDTIAYCGPYLITNWTEKNTFVFKANEKYWNADAVNVKTLTWYFNDSSDVMKSYNDCIANITDSCSLNDSNMQQCKADGNYDDYHYISSTDATSYMGWLNVNRGGTMEVDGEMVEVGFANFNDDTKAVSPQDEEARARTHAAMLNQNFRMAICTGFDRGAHNAQVVGEELKEKSLINSYTPGDFVHLKEDVTVDINGTSKTYPANTNYGVILQDQLDADGVPLKVYDPAGNDGAGSSSSFEGWYSPANSKAYLDKAVEELAEQGLEISAENPIQIDITFASNIEQYSNRANVFKKSIEESTGGLIQVNLVACTDAPEWNDATYWPTSGAGMNGNYSDNSGWGPDYGDPASYLDTLYADGNGSMLKCLGLF